MTEIDFRQGTNESVKLPGLLAGNPLNYRHQQADGFPATETKAVSVKRRSGGFL